MRIIMSKLTKYAKKKRDKKYDPYKMVKRQNKKLESMSEQLLKEAVEYTDNGEIKLDSAGKPVFKDVIQWETDGPQIMAVWTCYKTLLEERLVPPNEEEAAFDAMSMYAKEWRDTNKKYTITVPINYFVGTWHVMNSCRKFGLFHHDKPLAKSIDGLAMWFAKQIDMYHEVKRREKVQDEASPSKVLSLPKAKTFEEFQKEVKLLPSKK